MTLIWELTTYTVNSFVSPTIFDAGSQSIRMPSIMVAIVSPLGNTLIIITHT